MWKIATKTPYERDQERTEDLVRPSPKNKPPRHDLRNRNTDTETDPDTARPSADTDPDLSRNYKKVAQWVIGRTIRRNPHPAPEGAPRPKQAPEPERQNGQAWRTPDGLYAAKYQDEIRYGFRSHEAARMWAQGASSKGSGKPEGKPAPAPEEALQGPKEETPPSKPVEPVPEQQAQVPEPATPDSDPPEANPVDSEPDNSTEPPEEAPANEASGSEPPDSADPSQIPVPSESVPEESTAPSAKSEEQAAMEQSWEEASQHMTDRETQELAKALKIPFADGKVDFSKVDPAEAQEEVAAAAKALQQLNRAKGRGPLHYLKALQKSDLPASVVSRRLQQALRVGTLVEQSKADPSFVSSLVEHLEPKHLEKVWKSLDGETDPAARALKSNLYLSGIALDKPLTKEPGTPGLRALAKTLTQRGMTGKVLEPDGSFDLSRAMSDGRMDAAFAEMSDKDIGEAVGGAEGPFGPLVEAFQGTDLPASGKTWARQHLKDMLHLYMTLGITDQLAPSKGKGADQELEDREKELGDEDLPESEDWSPKKHQDHLNSSLRTLSQQISEAWSNREGTDEQAKKKIAHHTLSWIDEMLKSERLSDQQRALLNHARQSESPWETLQLRADPPLLQAKAANFFAYTGTNLGKGNTLPTNLRGTSPQRGLHMTTKQAVLQVTAELDNIAAVIVQKAAELGLPPKVAEDFAVRCDKLADMAEEQAGIRRDASGSLVEDLGAPTKPVESPSGSPEGVALLGDQEENSEFLGLAVSEKLTEAKAIAKAAGLLTAAQEVAIVTSQPGMSPESLRNYLGQMIDIQQATVVAKKTLDAQLRAKGLADSEKSGVEALKKVATQLGKDSQGMADVQQGLMSFMATLVAAQGTPTSGEKADDFFSKIPADLGETLAGKIAQVSDASSADLAEISRIMSPLRIVAKTAAIRQAALKEAGLADIVVGFKSWLAGEAGGLVPRVVGFAGTITQWVDKKMFRSQQIDAACKDLIKALAAAESALEGLTKTAAQEEDEKPCACKE